MDREEMLDIFRVDAEYEVNETMWSQIRGEILGEAGGESDSSSDSGSDSDDADDDSSGSSSSDDDDDGGGEAKGGEGGAGGAGEGGEGGEAAQQGFGGSSEITDMSGADLVNLRRTIYLTIMSSMDFEECGHKIMKMGIPPGRENELVRHPPSVISVISVIYHLSSVICHL